MNVTVYCDFKRETEKAVLIVDHGTGEELWLPLSQVAEMHKDRDGKGHIVVSEWIAKQKGLAE